MRRIRCNQCERLRQRAYMLSMDDTATKTRVCQDCADRFDLAVTTRNELAADLRDMRNDDGFRDRDDGAHRWRRLVHQVWAEFADFVIDADGAQTIDSADLRTASRDPLAR